MLTWVAVFALSLLSAMAFTPFVIQLAPRLGAVDHAMSSRKVHASPIPRLGGLAIVAAAVAPILVLLVAGNPVSRVVEGGGGRVLALVLGGALIAGLGVYDDVRGADAKVKFGVQFAAAALAYACGYGIDEIANPFGEPVRLGWMALPFTMVWIVGVVNALNLIDGLDGLAGGVALVALGATFGLASLRGAVLTMLVTAALAGALLGFLRFNFNPASIFMGDTGSMFVGFVLATCAIDANRTHGPAVSLLVPIVVLGLPIADTLLAMARRWLRGVPLFRGDRGHIHHRLLARGLSQRVAVGVLYGASAVLAIAACGLALATTRAQATLLLVGLAASAAIALRSLGFLRVDRAMEAIAARRANLARRAALRVLDRRLACAAELEEVWQAVKDARAPLGADAVALRCLVVDRAGAVVPARFSAGLDGAPAGLLRTRHSLRVERPDAAAIELGWRTRSELDRDTELAVEELCRWVHGAISRVTPLPRSAPASERPRAAVRPPLRAWPPAAVRDERPPADGP